MKEAEIRHDKETNNKVRVTVSQGQDAIGEKVISEKGINTDCKRESYLNEGFDDDPHTAWSDDKLEDSGEEWVPDRGNENAQLEKAEKPSDSGETIPDRGSVQDQPSNSCEAIPHRGSDLPSNSDETISDRGHEVNFESEDSDEESEEEEDLQVEEGRGRGRGRYNLRPNPELARRYEGYVAYYLSVF